MRVSSILLATSIVAFAAGCHRASTTTSVAANGPAIHASPVGPIPGATEPVSYPLNPLGGDPVALQDGRRLFNWYNCSGCHGGHAGGGMGPSLRDPIWLYGDRDDQLFDTIAHGRSKGMPAWGTKIPRQQIWELVAYIKSLGTANEPDPPVEPTEEQVTDPVQEQPTDQGIVTRIAGEQ